MVASGPAEDAEALLDAIYGAIQTPTAWTSIVPMLSDWLGADSAIMITPHLANYRGAPALFHNVDPAPIQNYAKYAGKAPWTDRALATGRAPGAFHWDELMAPEERATSEYIADLVDPIGYTSALFALLTLPGEHGAAPPIMLSLYRKRPRPMFDDADLARLAMLFPHLRRAILLSYKSDGVAISAELEGVLGAIGSAAFLLDADSRVVFANEAARALTAGASPLRERDGRLVTENARDQRDLQSALQAATARSVVFQWRPRRTVEIRSASARPLFVSVIPLGDDLASVGAERRPRALVLAFGHDLRPAAAALDILKTCFGFTSAEAEVAAHLTMGQTTKEIAARRGTTLATIQGQVKSGLSKAGLPRQSALVAFVACLQMR